MDIPVLDDAELKKITDWRLNIVEPIIKPNNLDKLIECTLHLSRIIYYDDIDIKKYLDKISILQKELKIKNKERSDIKFNRPTHIIESINEFMFKEKGFRANIHDYHNPLNNFLNIVIEKKVGIPITLSIIYISLAQSINFTIYPVNFPRHFLVKHILDDNDEIVIDPFNQGRIMDDYALKSLLDKFFPNKNFPLTKNLVEKATLAQVIMRMLNNIKDSFFEIQEFDKFNIANEMILAIDSRNSYAIRDKGILLRDTDPERALKLLNTYLEIEPEANDVDDILKLIRNIKEKSG